MASRFDYPQAEEIRDAFARHAVRYLFLGKSGAIPMLADRLGVARLPKKTGYVSALSTRQATAR